MEKKSDQLENFERYRKGLLSGKSLDDFEKKLNADQSLKSEFNLFKDIEDLLSKDASEDLAFEKELKAISAQRKKKTASTNEKKVSPTNKKNEINPAPEKNAGYNLKYLLGGIALILFAGVLLFLTQKESSTTQTFSIGESLTTSENNFTPNSSLEYLIEKQDAESTLQSKIETNPSTSSGKTDFAISVFSDSEISGKKFKGHIFSNKKSDYVNFLPILSEELELQSEANRYQFNFRKPVKLKPGLYYFLIENAESEQVVFVEKFTI